MIYKAFGNTGIKISSLGFGCMRFPIVKQNGEDLIDQDKVTEMIQQAYKEGVNYFDSAWFYNKGLSEAALGKAIKGFRDEIYISSKSPGHLVKKKGDFNRFLEKQLERLDIDSIDFYHFHGIGYNNFYEIDKRSGWIDDAIKAKSQGLIKHICFSFHDEPANMFKLIDIGLFESVLCQYNVIDRSNEAAMAYAKQKGLGVVVMGPLGGGRVIGLPREISTSLGLTVKSNAELALRFVFANPNIDCALSGMENIQMLNENVAISAQRDPLEMNEIDAITQVMQENERLSELYCTGCGYCQPCPEGVNIPHIFKNMNYHKIYSLTDFAKKGYAQIGKFDWASGTRADACIECGECEQRCPQKIPIIEQLKESHLALK